MDDGVLREITVSSEGNEWLVAVLKKRLPNHDLKNYIDGLDEDDAFDSFYKRAWPTYSSTHEEFVDRGFRHVLSHFISST
jgi:hypothetical protein